MPDLLKGRVGHGSVAMGNKLYIVGGLGTQRCEVFDYVSKMFTQIKPMPLRYVVFHKLRVSFFRVKDKIIVKNDLGEEEEDNIYIYDTKKDNWSTECVKYFKENNCEVLYI